jgi:photosystem II stability/assembly factor-like uncharacterized protein
MKSFLIVLTALAAHTLHAQQYGWVRVAQIGNQFTSLRSVEFVDSLSGWTAEGGSTIYKTTDAGTTWNGFPGDPMGVEGFSMLNKLYGWCVGEQASLGKILRTTNGGVTWTTQFQKNNRYLLGTSGLSLEKNITSGSTQNFSPDTGKVAQTINGGATWTERTIADSIRQLRKMQFVDSLHGWIIYWTDSGGGLLRTTDGGSNFSMFPSPLPLALSFLDSENGFIIYGNVYRTYDGGQTWEQRGQIRDPFWGDVSTNTLSFVDTLNGWAYGFQFYQGDITGTIYGTTDGGFTWTRELIGPVRHIRDGIMLDRFHGWAVGDEGSVFAYRMVTSVPEKLPAVPTRSALKQNYPNPFNPTTSIEYEVVRPSLVDITVYDLSGKEVHTLVHQMHEPGVYRIQFNARSLASGVYVYRMKAGDYTVSKQMIILR